MMDTTHKLTAKLDREKAIEVLLYVTREVPNAYSALSVIYFADKQHLNDWGRLIYGENYRHLSIGPTPMTAYNIIRRGYHNRLFLVQWGLVTTQREPDFKFLSVSDHECLSDAIVKYGDMPLSELRTCAHTDPAYQHTELGKIITIERIAESLPDSEELLSYLRDDAEADCASMNQNNCHNCKHCYVAGAPDFIGDGPDEIGTCYPACKLGHLVEDGNVCDEWEQADKSSGEGYL